MKKSIIAILLALPLLSACIHHHDHGYHRGHHKDRHDGPGNSDNAPGHNKHKHDHDDDHGHGKGKKDKHDRD